MSQNISKIDIKHAHDEYLRLLREYLSAKQEYEYDDTVENWDNLQETLLALKRHNDKMDR